MRLKGTIASDSSEHVAGFELCDLAQLLASTGKDRALRVEFKNHRGTLFFRKGSLVHASTNNASGEEAFYEMLRWGGGSFEDTDHYDPNRLSDNINVSTMCLIMEAARRKSESSVEGLSPENDLIAPSGNAPKESDESVILQDPNAVPVTTGKGEHKVSMYRSLYPVLNSLHLAKANGTLRIAHDTGQRGYMVLREGIIQGVKVGELSGPNAAVALTMWISTSTDFMEGTGCQEEHGHAIDTPKLLSFLKKVEHHVEKIRKYTSSNRDVFRLTGKDAEVTSRVEEQQLKVALELDGKRTVAQIVSTLDMPEFHVAYSIYKLCKIGIAERITHGETQPMKEPQRLAFFNDLEAILTEIVGPAATLLIDESLQSRKIDREALDELEIPDLLQNISEQLDAEDREIFSKRILESTKKLKKSELEVSNFLSALNEKLTEMMGPAASLVIEDAFKKIVSDPDSVDLDEIPDLIEKISEQLERSDQEALNKWFQNHR